jgi:hypothetical protein
VEQPLHAKNVMAGVFHDIGARMVALDPVGAPRVIKAARWHFSEYDRDGGTFDTIDEYIIFRTVNIRMRCARAYIYFNWLIVFSIMTSSMMWTLNINLNDAETELCSTYYRLGGLDQRLLFVGHGEEGCD